MKLLLSKPRGFCAGVDRAIESVERAIELWGAPVYVKHEIVHNRYVVDGLREKGAIFVEDLDDVPVGSRLIYSAAMAVAAGERLRKYPAAPSYLCPGAEWRPPPQRSVP